MTDINATVTQLPDINANITKLADIKVILDSTGPQGIQGIQGIQGEDGASGEKNESFILNATDITNGYIDIVGNINNAQTVHLFIENIGILAEVGVDFSYSGNNLYWTGYELANTLEIGDKLKVFYI